MKVAAVHWTFDLQQPDASCKGLLDLAERTLAVADLVVLPELPWGPFLLDRQGADAYAESLEGPTVAALSEVARGRGVLVSGLLLREGQSLANAQLVFDRDGSLAGIYRKHHLWGPDYGWATPGYEPGAVLETSVGRIGLLICHDVVYPETVVAVTRQRPDALAFSTAWVGDGVLLPESWVAAAQLLRGAPFVAANRGGREGPFSFDDPSAVLRWDAATGRVIGHAGRRTRRAYTVTLDGVEEQT